MGYIKKLKNNELVGGTDKTTIYPVTSTKAIFEEVSDNEFKSQKYLNNHITNERIVDNTIENSKLKDDTIDMGKLNTQLKTIIQNAYDASWKVKEEPFSLETKYNANDVVYDPATNSSYVSLTADNQGNPVNPEDEGYVEGKWRVVINGISAIESTEVIDAKVTELETRVDNKIEELDTEVDNKIDNAQEQLDAKIADVQVQLDAVTKGATDAASEARDAASTVETLTSQQVADAQIGYFECTDTAASGAAANETKITTTDTIGESHYVKTVGSHVKIKMATANTHAAPVYLQFGTNTATSAQLYYNGEAVSASNSWEEGEVISVYFDGTNYQASNAQGGGGKAEKIKYDNSASGLDAENVQGALDEINRNTFADGGKILPVQYTEGYYISASGELTSNPSWKASEFLHINAVAAGDTFVWSSISRDMTVCIAFYAEDGTFMQAFSATGTSRTITIANDNSAIGATKVRASFLISGIPSLLHNNIDVLESNKHYATRSIQDIADELDSLAEEVAYGSKLSISYGADGMTSGVILMVDGNTSSNASYMTSDYIELPANTTSLHTSTLISNNADTYIGLVLYNNAKSKLATVCEKGQSIPEIIDVKNNYPSAKYIRYCSTTSASPTVDVYTAGTIKDAIDELIDVKPLGELIKVSEHSYGNDFTGGRNYGNQPLWFTHQNVASENDGILKSIWFYAPDAGTYEFAVGLLDQRSTLVNERYFKLTFNTTGVHNVDVYDMEIKINKGEQLFAHFVSTLRAQLYNDAVEYTSLYAKSSTNEFTKNWTHGAISGLGWTVFIVDSPFALKSDIKELESKIDSLEQQAGNIGYVISQNGEKYRMSVNNGEIVLLPTKYKKVVALGNSLTNHGPNESIGWYGGAWAMAATRENTGWTQQFQRILRQKESNATVTGVSVYSWERNPTTANLSDMLDSYLTNDVDCIIFRAGENAHPSDSNTWSEQIKTLLNYCLTRCPNASIILSTCMWFNTTKDNAIAKVANDWGLPLVYPGTGTNLERMGDYVEGSDLQLHKITDAGVAKHANDVGFLKFANRLAVNIGYNTIDEQHYVTVVDDNNIGYTCFSSWVANGIFNIKTTATTVTAVDANNNALTVTNHGDEFFTFVMPDTNVTITIA